MNTYDYLVIEDDGDALTWITLARPDRANALSDALLDEFADALERLKVSGNAVIGVRGTGRGFSSGYDIGEVGKPKAPDPVRDRARLERNLGRYLAIWNHPKPVIAAVHGYCLAGATQMCVYADMTIVAEDARIGEPAVPFGGGYIAPVWTPLVGAKRAKELAFLPGNHIDGITAVEWGWANHAVPADRVFDATRSLAERIALIPSEILELKKRAVNRVAEQHGYITAVSTAPEMDALLHLAPSVLALRQRIADEGLKPVMESFRVAPSREL